MKKDVWVGLIIFALSVLCGWDLKDVQNPDIIKNQVGVALFPWMMVISLGGLGLFVAGAALWKLRRGEDVPKAPGVPFWTKYTVPFLMLVILTAYILLVPVVGFYAMSVLFFFALGLLLGGFRKKNVITTGIGAVVTVAIAYGIFQVSLQLWMPEGFLF
jgi:uncharacterized iron-regulated membrane protein